MTAIVLLLYLAACLVCGIMGRNTTLGFVGHTLLALFITPVLDFLIQALGRPSAYYLERLRKRS